MLPNCAESVIMLNYLPPNLNSVKPAKKCVGTVQGGSLKINHVIMRINK